LLEEKDILETVKKINVVAYPIKGENAADYEVKRQELKDIIDQEQYKMLMKYGSNKQGATLKYLGEEDAIDEIIVFASDDEKGFALFRLLGDNMEPEKDYCYLSVINLLRYRFLKKNRRLVCLLSISVMISHYYS